MSKATLLEVLVLLSLNQRSFQKSAPLYQGYQKNVGPDNIFVIIIRVSYTTYTSPPHTSPAIPPPLPIHLSPFKSTIQLDLLHVAYTFSKSNPQAAALSWQAPTMGVRAEKSPSLLLTLPPLLLTPPPPHPM